MPNDFYTPTGNPADNSNIVSSDMRAEFAAINAGFNKLPTLTGNANKLVVINSSGTGMDVTLTPAGLTSINKIALTQPATGATLTILDGKTLTANHSLTLAGTDGTTMTFPATSASVARIDAAQTFAGEQTFSALINANLGITVAGAAFNSRGITDNATAKALTLSGSGANSVTIANSATNPTIGTSGGGLQLSSAVGIGASSPTAGVQLTVKSAANGTVGSRITNLNAAPTVDVLQTAVDVAAGTGYYHYRAYELLSSAPNPVFSIRGDGTVSCGGNISARAAIAPIAGGVAAISMGSGGHSIGLGSGAPTYSAPQGSIYLRTDGTTTNNRMYVNTDGGTTWTAVTTAA